MLIPCVCVCVVISVPHGVGVDHSTTAGETRGQVSPLLGQRLFCLHRAWRPGTPLSCRETALRSISPLCISFPARPSPPSSARRWFSISFYSLVESARLSSSLRETAFLRGAKEPTKWNTKKDLQPRDETTQLTF